MSVGLLDRISARTSGRDLEKRYSADTWINDYLIPASFQFGGHSYQTGSYGLTQTLAGNRAAEIVSTLPGYLAALRRCPPAFAAQLVRALVLSQARFVFRNRPWHPATPRRLWGSTELSMLETPWRNATTGELIARMEWHAGLAGNAYVMRRPNRLRVLRPDWTAILYGSDLEPDDPGHAIDGELIGYVYWNQGPFGGYQPNTILPDSMAHWSPIPDPESPGLGMSWITPAIREIQKDQVATQHTINYFANGCTPNLIVKGITGPNGQVLTKEQFLDIVDMMEERHSGVANAYRSLYLTAGADATVVGSNLAEVDLKSVNGSAETRISMLSRVHPTILAAAEGLAGSSLNAGNFGMARRIWADSWIYPTLQDLAASLAPLVRIPSDSELWTDVTDMPILREDAKDAAEIQQILASTITSLRSSGLTFPSIIAAVTGQNMALLKEDPNWASVQLQKAGTATAVPDASQPPTPPDAGGAGLVKASGYGPPSRSTDDAAHGGRVHIEVTAKSPDGFSGGMSLSDFADIVGRELADRRRSSALGGHVGDVGHGVPQEQVLGSDAGWVIAGVADGHAGGDRPDSQRVGDAMGAVGDSSVRPDDAVSTTVGIAGTSPGPASVTSRLQDFVPKALSQRNPSHGVSLPKALGPRFGIRSSDDIDDEPFDGDLDQDTLALLFALARVEDGLDERGWSPTQAAKHPRNPAGTPGGGKFRSIAARIADAVTEHLKGDGKGDPFPGFDREQLRRAAKARGITLKRGAGKDEIAKALLDDLGVKKPSPETKTPPGPAKVAKKAVEKATPKPEPVGRRRKMARASGEDLIGSGDGSEVAGHALRTAATRETVRGSGEGPHGDESAYAVAARQRFDGRPATVTSEQMDSLVAQGHQELHRGVQPGHGKTAEQMKEEFRSGPAYYGYGIWGNGIYTSTQASVARGYGSRTRMALHKDAKVVEWRDFKAEHEAFVAKLTPGSDAHRVFSDSGRYAMARGYDAVRITGSLEHEVFVLNRSALFVQDE